MKLINLIGSISLYLAYEVEVEIAREYARPGKATYDIFEGECQVLPENWRAIEWDDYIKINLYDNERCEGTEKEVLNPDNTDWEFKVGSEHEKLVAFKVTKAGEYDSSHRPPPRGFYYEVLDENYENEDNDQDEDEEYSNDTQQGMYHPQYDGSHRSPPRAFYDEVLDDNDENDANYIIEDSYYYGYY